MSRIRLVDAVSYRKELESEKTCCERSEDLLMGLEIAIADLGDMPDIDPIHAVGGTYCYECLEYINGYCKIRKDSFGCKLERGPHDFCSDGHKT